MQLVSSTSTSSMERPIGSPPSVSLLGLLAKIKSVVSVLISLISDTTPIGGQDISPIFAVRRSVWAVLNLCHGLAWYCTYCQERPYPIIKSKKRRTLGLNPDSGYQNFWYRNPPSSNIQCCIDLNDRWILFNEQCSFRMSWVLWQAVCYNQARFYQMNRFESLQVTCWTLNSKVLILKNHFTTFWSKTNKII